LKKTPKKKAGEEYLVVNKTKEKCGDERLMIKEGQKDDVGQWTHCSQVISSTKKQIPWSLVRYSYCVQFDADGFICPFFEPALL
jgi:hypothetical protein